MYRQHSVSFEAKVRVTPAVARLKRPLVAYLPDTGAAATCSIDAAGHVDMRIFATRRAARTMFRHARRALGLRQRDVLRRMRLTRVVMVEGLQPHFYMRTGPVALIERLFPGRTSVRSLHHGYLVVDIVLSDDMQVCVFPDNGMTIHAPTYHAARTAASFVRNQIVRHLHHRR